MITSKENRQAEAIAAIIMILTVTASAYIAVYVLPLPTEAPPPEAYRCPHNATTDYGIHTVTFVVIDTWGNPLEDMLVDCKCDRLLQDNRCYSYLLFSKDRDEVTQDDGSCRFRLVGRTQYHITVYNETMDVQKDFKLYPMNSCYSLILHNGRDGSGSRRLD